MSTRPFSNPKLIFILLVLLALTIRSVYFNQTAKFIQPGPGSDSDFYIRWAGDIVQGNVLGKGVFYALPVYPYFLSLAYLYSGGEIFTLILVQILIGSINCGLVYILGRKLFNHQVGIIACIIACGYLMFIFYDRMLLPASLSICLSLLSLLLLLKAQDAPGFKIWFNAGLFLGLCALSSASFLLVAIFILFWIIYEYKKTFLKRALLYCLAFIVPFCLVIGLIALRNYLVAGDATCITAHSGINFYLGNNPQANGLFRPPAFMRPTQSGLVEDAHIVAEQISGRRLKASEASYFWFKRSLNFISSHPLNYLRLLGKKFVLFWNGKEYVDDIDYYIFSEEAGLPKLAFFRFYLIVPFGLLGLILSWPLRNRVMLLYLFVFALMLATISFFINSRYRLIAAPYLIIFAGAGLWQIFQKYKNKQHKGLVFSLILVGLFYFLTNIKVEAVDTLLDFTFHYNKGIYLTEQKDYLKAQKEFQAALKLNPRDFMSYFGMGNVYYQMQDFTGAIENFQKSLAINPYFYNAHFNLGIVYKEMGDAEKSKQEFKEVLRLKPDDCAAHYNLGRIYQEKGLNHLALKEYKMALEIKPGLREILQAIGGVKKDRGL